MVAFKHTRQPALCAQFLAFLAREDNMRETMARHPNIPAAATLLRTGVEYPGASEHLREALASFARQADKIAPTAYDFQGWRYQRAAMNALTTRISQVLTRELDIETAARFVKKDVELAIQAAGK